MLRWPFAWSDGSDFGTVGAGVRPPAMTGAATTYFDNAASTGQDEGDVPRSQLAMRETTGPGVRAGFLMLVPPQAPRYLLVPSQLSSELQVYDLLRPDEPGVAVLHGDEMYVYSAAVSIDGASIFLGCNSPWGRKRFNTSTCVCRSLVCRVL